MPTTITIREIREDTPYLARKMQEEYGSAFLVDDQLAPVEDIRVYGSPTARLFAALSLDYSFEGDWYIKGSELPNDPCRIIELVNTRGYLVIGDLDSENPENLANMSLVLLNGELSLAQDAWRDKVKKRLHDVLTLRP